MDQENRPLSLGPVLIFAAAALAYLIFFAIVTLSLKETPLILGSILTASATAAAFISAAFFSNQTERRNRISIAFEIARRWDDAPYLEARDQTRGKSAQQLCDQLDSDKVKLALIHFTNLFWEIAVATRTKVADESYLKERFRLTLNTFYPAFRKMHSGPKAESGALVALDAITRLHLGWNVGTPIPSVAELRIRLNTSLSELDQAGAAVDACNTNF